MIISVPSPSVYALANKFVDFFLQIFQQNRFREVVVAACLQSLVPVAFHGIGSLNNYRQVRKFRFYNAGCIVLFYTPNTLQAPSVP